MIVCRQCGHENAGGTDFCESCGTFLEWDGERLGERVEAGPPAGSPSDAPSGPEAGSGTAPPAEPATGSVGAGGGGDGDTVICLECGGRNAPDRRFCRRCGATLDLVALSRRPAPPAEDAPASSTMRGVPVPPTSPPPRPAPPPSPAAPPAPTADHHGGPPAEVAGTTAGGLVARPPTAPVPPAPRVEARPPAPRPGVAPAPARGVQPAEPKARPAPARPRRAEVEVAPGGPACPDCGVANPPGRRFCRRCGADLPAAASAAPAAVPGGSERRRSWWRPVLDRVRGSADRDGEGAPATRSARAAYRRSLDVRFRVLRVLAVVAGVGVLAGGLGLVGINPISGVRSLWDRYFPRDERIGELRATVVPEGTIEADFPPGAAVDGDPSTAWATTWLLEPDAPAADACTSGDGSDEAAAAEVQGGATAGLVINLPGAAEVSKVEVQPGLEAGDPARAGHWHPTLLEVRFDDGTCETIELNDGAGFQDHRIDGPETTTVRIRVLDAAPPTDPAASRGLVAVGEVRVFEPD